jgi:hypothetical protein
MMRWAPSRLFLIAVTKAGRWGPISKKSTASLPSGLLTGGPQVTRCMLGLQTQPCAVAAAAAACSVTALVHKASGPALHCEVCQQSTSQKMRRLLAMLWHRLASIVISDCTREEAIVLRMRVIGTYVEQRVGS